MSEFVGRQIEVGVAVETTRGTPASAPEKWLKKINATIVERSEKKDDESTRGVLEDSLGTRIVKKWIEGDLEGNVHADAIGYLLYNLYGAVSSVAAGGGAFTHSFTMAQSIQHASLSLFSKDGSATQLVYDNCMIGSLEFSAVVDDYVKFTASFMGADSAANASSPSYSTEYDFVGRDIVVKFADTEAGLAAATAVKVKEITLTFETALIADHILGQFTPDDVYNANLSIGIEFMLNYDDTTFKTLFLADTYKYMSVAITGTAVIGASSNPTLSWIFNRVQVQDWNREGAADDLVTQPVTVKAYYNQTDGEASTCSLVNLTTEYNIP